MRLLQFVDKAAALRPPYHRIKCFIGAFVGDSEDNLVNLSAACDLEKHGVTDMVSLLMQGPELMKSIKQKMGQNELPLIKRKDVRILPPITSPDKILCVGMNYADHCAEQNQPVPKEPVIFNKFPPSLIGPEDDCIYPTVTKCLDWEVELALVVGKTITAGSNPDVEASKSAIAAYVATQDISAREWQSGGRNMNQWQMCKALDTFCPMAASIVTADDLPADFACNVGPLAIGCSVNGEVKQTSQLTQLVHKPADIIAYCAKFWTLLPGDLILTGTPPGVGVFRKPPEYLKRGDVISTTIESIGTFTTKVSAFKQTMISYPEFKREDVTDVYGVNKSEVKDPYRWLENPDAEDTKDFVAKQQELFKKFVSSSTVKDKFKNRLQALWDYPKYGSYHKEGSHYFHSFNSGLQNQNVLYIHKQPGDEGTIFFDPNSLSADGTVALHRQSFSEDGRYWAYGLTDGGSDWITIKFREIFDDGTWKDLPDVLNRVKFSSMTWTHNNKGFFYNRYPVSNDVAHGKATDENIHQKLYYHLIGTTQDQDVLCAEFPDNPKWMVGAEVSHCGRYLIVTPEEGCDPRNRLFYCDLSALNFEINGLLPLVKVVDNFDAQYEYVTNEGSLFIFKTNLNAPRYKIITIDFARPEQNNWKTLIEEDGNDVLKWAACTNETMLFTCYIHDVKDVMRVHDLNTGKLLPIEIPLEICEVVGFSGKKKDTELFIQITTFLSPGKILHWNFKQDPDFSKGPSLLKEIKLNGFDSSGFEVKQVFYKSKDGTSIPMFIIESKGIKLDGNNPVWLYGYGGFNISLLPSFSVTRLVFLSNFKGVYAVANIRGGGEYGETWHKSGSLGKKQNCFDDFQYAAEYLISQKYTTQKRLMISGGSNGGLLVAACVNQRPDLYGCGVAEVGVLDMLRFHRFTIGHAWTTDYGCSDDPEQFEWLIKYSPYHNVPDADKIEKYPALLVVTADHDDRVVPLHSMKHTAQVQYKLGGKKPEFGPILMRIESRVGHGFGRPTGKIIEQQTDVWTFAQLVLNLEWHE